MEPFLSKLSRSKMDIYSTMNVVKKLKTTYTLLI